VVSKQINIQNMKVLILNIAPVDGCQLMFWLRYIYPSGVFSQPARPSLALP
jgi:hypothetical protein